MCWPIRLNHEIVKVKDVLANKVIILDLIINEGS
jgi:hypothetical protein